MIQYKQHSWIIALATITVVFIGFLIFIIESIEVLLLMVMVVGVGAIIAAFVLYSKSFPQASPEFLKVVRTLFPKQGWKFTSVDISLPYRALQPLGNIPFINHKWRVLSEDKKWISVFDRFFSGGFHILTQYNKSLKNRLVYLVYATLAPRRGFLWLGFLIVQTKITRSIPGWVLIQPHDSLFSSMSAGAEFSNADFNQAVKVFASNQTLTKKIISADFEVWYVKSSKLTIYVENDVVSGILYGQPSVEEMEKLSNTFLQAVEILDKGVY